MAKKLYTLVALVFLFWAANAQQQILLLTETFENGPSTLQLNAGGVGTNTGNNTWTINNDYTGQPTYPNTPPQDSVVSGTINGAPHSHYLHIHDSTTTTVDNANWNPNSASDRFCYLGSPFCTLGMSNVIFTFFWICEGNSGAYGQVYYRIDGGAWIPTGQPKYYNQNKWKYEVIQDPAFNNVQNLQLGFRWVNPGGGGASNISFGIDDIIAVGTYDDINNPVTVNVTYLFPDTVCQQDYLTIGYTLSAPLCDGTYQIEMSDANGSFANPTNGGVFNISAPDTTGFIGYQVPNNVTGNCFKVRISRVSPLPVITGTASICFAIKHCPVTVVTNNAPVMNDQDTTCVLSVIDVKFNSYGNFNIGNDYVAELSDSTGSFANPYHLGDNYSSDQYPAMPGTVSGLIPQSVPSGCGYYIRIRSTNPPANGTVIGPFCLVHCDELTNNHEDIHLCIPANIPYPSCSTIVIHPNQWNTQASYDTCNNWTVELRDMTSFGLINSGGIGVYHDSIGGNFVLCVPSTADSLPVAPGSYYMRIVSNCSNVPWNQTGSVIRITIGAPSQTPPIISSPDTIHCNVGLVDFYVSPFLHPPSDYEWSSNLLNNGQAFTWPYNPLIVNLAGANLNDYILYVREVNYGCYGPSSAAHGLTVIGEPTVHITGDTTVCLGDTVTYSVTYLKETYYNWDAPGGVQILDEANSQTTVIFNNLGDYTISNFSLNECGGDSGTYSVHVVTPYSVNAGPDQTVCTGADLGLHVTTGTVNKVFVTEDTATASRGKQGAMFNIIAHDDVVIDSFAVKFSSTNPIQAEIYDKHGSYRTYEQNAGAWSQVGGFYNFTPNAVTQMTVIPGGVNQFIAAGDSFGFYITTANTPAINMATTPVTGSQGTVYKSDGVIDFVQGTANNYAFGTFTGPRVVNVKIYYSTRAGLHYLWNTGATTDSIHVHPQRDSIYTVIVYDTSGCRNKDSVAISVRPIPSVYAGPDTLVCKGVEYPINATSSVTTINWEPQTGLSSYSILNPVFFYNDSVLYVLTATDSAGCSASDTLLIRVKGPTVDAGPDTTICPDIDYQIVATASDGSILWSPAAGLSNDNTASPVFNYNQTVMYIIQVTDTSGCKAFDTLNIDIGCLGYIKVPQAFTPNGDGTNDHFTVFGDNIAEYEIRIYNRWGEQVYDSRDLGDLNDLGRGWDGTYKGKLQDSGVFVYYLTAKDTYGKKYEKKGNITLIR